MFGTLLERAPDLSSILEAILDRFWEILDGFWMDLGKIFEAFWKGIFGNMREALQVEELTSMIRATRGR